MLARQQSSLSTRLFYSYSHMDEQYREDMEKSLGLLRSGGLLKEWHDRMILPGQRISKKTKEKMGEADIIVFLLSQSFIDSEACMSEWNYAGQLAEDKELYRIPVILEECAWLDMLGDDDVLALPEDGKPVAAFERQAIAWQQVYEGIKRVVIELRNTFTPRPDFLTKIETTEFLSEHHIKLQDIFEFLPLFGFSTKGGGEETITKTTNPESLFKRKYSLIHGTDRCGKTALCRYLILTLIGQSQPVLFIDLKESSLRPVERSFAEQYFRQFNGDYAVWKEQTDKTLILDNLTADPKAIDFIVFARGFFDRIVVTLSSDVLHSYYRGDERLAEFQEMELGFLSQSQQERLIRKRLELSEREEALTDGRIDQVEEQVNSIIISSKLVPRYPFFVLTILQTLEGFMPTDTTITSYGHCYYALILAWLMKAGIGKRDQDINPCLNFAENLAFAIYQHGKSRKGSAFDFDEFTLVYMNHFIISDQVINRLKHVEFGIITNEGTFRTQYMYYYFLGKYLSKGGDDNRAIIEEMCGASHVDSNYLTLLFAIHHTSDEHIIDEILVRSMCSLEMVPPATLNHEETRKFAGIVEALPDDILSERSVDEERQRVRDVRDEVSRDQIEINDLPDGIEEEPVNACYRILKSNDIMGQILRNKHGSLEKQKVEDIIETIAESGLRLVNLFLMDENEIADIARYVISKNPEFDIKKVKREIVFFSFAGTKALIEHIVRSINVPEIKQEINRVVERKSEGGPVYELIGYFNQLDGAPQLRQKEKDDLARFLKKHDDNFLRRIVSLRTQHYMNTHRSETRINQAVCSLLSVKYRARYRGN